MAMPKGETMSRLTGGLHVLCGPIWWLTMLTAALWADSAQAQMAPKDLLVLYSFQEGTGNVIKDRSGVSPSLDLQIETPGSVSWLVGSGLDVYEPAIIRSRGPATKIIDAVQRSNEITVEAWIRPSNTSQDGPARIVSISVGTGQRNVTIGQQGNQYEVRLRTTQATENGLPRYRSQTGTVAEALTHLVYVRHADGRLDFYVNGKKTPLQTVPGLDGVSEPSDDLLGEFTNWAANYPLLLAGEGAERPWLGQFHGLAIYSRALEATELLESPKALQQEAAPIVSGLHPPLSTPFHKSEKGLRFEVTAVPPKEVDPDSIRLQFNGAGVTRQILLREPISNGWAVVYDGLEPNRLYHGEIMASDREGAGTRQEILFDTYGLWEPRRLDKTGVVLSPVHHPVDLHLPIKGDLAKDPFSTEVLLVALGPRNERLHVPGFYKGPGLWCLRFSAVSEGEWTLRTLSSDGRLSGHSAKLIAGPNPNPRVRGRIEVDPLHPHHFRYTDGSPFFLLGYEIDWLWALELAEPGEPRIQTLLDNIAGGGFNHILVNVYAHDTWFMPGITQKNDFGPPAMFLWAGTNQSPDHSRMNLDFFNHYDRMMQALYERGMNAHIMLKVYNKFVHWPAPRSPEEDLYFDYVVSRYQAFPNLVWDYSKEMWYETDTELIYDRMNRIRSVDGYNTITTLHDGVSFSLDPETGRVAAFITDQRQDDLYDTIIELRAKSRRPVINAEYGYEHGAGGPEDATYPHHVRTPIEMVQRAYELLMAGGYPVHYYSKHAWDIIEWEEVPPSLPAFTHLKPFFTSFPWYSLEPRPDYGSDGLLCLTDGEKHLVLFSRNGRGTLSVPHDFPGNAWTGYWMDVWNGERRDVRLSLEPGRPISVEAPFNGKPAAAHLVRDKGVCPPFPLSPAIHSRSALIGRSLAGHAGHRQRDGRCRINEVQPNSVHVSG